MSGTGTEDYFGDAWGFRQFDRPYYGVSLWEGYFPGDRVTAYRWHIQDPVPFTKSLKVSIEALYENIEQDAVLDSNGVVDEAKGSPDQVSEKIAALEGVNSAEVTDVRRAIG